jgi:hypothetical protein
MLSLNQREKIGKRNGLNEPDEVSKAAREHRPDESGKSTMTLSAATVTERRSRAAEPIMISWSAFCNSQNVYSIVIITPTDISKLSRVIIKLTTYLMGARARGHDLGTRQGSLSQ